MYSRIRKCWQFMWVLYDDLTRAFSMGCEYTVECGEVCLVSGDNVSMGCLYVCLVSVVRDVSSIVYDDWYLVSVVTGE